MSYIHKYRFSCYTILCAFSINCNYYYRLLRGFCSFSLSHSYFSCAFISTMFFFFFFLSLSHSSPIIYLISICQRQNLYLSLLYLMGNPENMEVLTHIVVESIANLRLTDRVSIGSAVRKNYFSFFSFFSLPSIWMLFTGFN